MAAAKVMRGEATMEDITYDFAGETEIYGSRHPRPTALAKVTGLADYGDDVALQMPEGVAHLAVVLAEAHHANIISIDTAEAEKMPGVIKVMTAKDVKGTNNMAGPGARAPAQRARASGSSRSSPARRSCRRGDVVALVAADTEEHARAAAKKVKQNLEILPAYMTFPEAVMPNAIQLHETLPNFYMEQPLFKGAGHRRALRDRPGRGRGQLPLPARAASAHRARRLPGLLGHRRHDDHPVQVPEPLREQRQASPWPAAFPRRTSACC